MSSTKQRVKSKAPKGTKVSKGKTRAKEKVSRGKRISVKQWEARYKRLEAKMRRLENAGALMEKEAIDDFNSRMMNVEISDIAKETYKELGPQITDLVHDMRDASLGVSMELHGSNPVDWTVLKNQVTEKRVRYVTFLKAAQEVGLTEQQARTVWFSPKARSRL